MSSQPQTKGPEGSARPESPPVPDEAFWNDDATADNSAWLASLASPGAEASATLRAVPTPTDPESGVATGAGTDAAEPPDSAPDLDAMFAAASDAVAASAVTAPVPLPTPARSTSPFAVVNDWVEPVEIEPVAAAAPPAGYEPAPIEAPVFEVDGPGAAAPAPAPLTADARADVAAEIEVEVAPPVPAPVEPVPAAPAPSPFAASFEADDTVMRDVMFTPVPTLAPAPAPEPAPEPAADAVDRADSDPYAWMDLEGIDDLLPGA